MTLIRTSSGNHINVERVMSGQSNLQGKRMIVKHYQEANGKMLVVLAQIQQMCTGEFATMLETQCVTDAICEATGLTTNELARFL